MNARALSSCFAFAIAALLLSFIACQTAFAAEGGLIAGNMTDAEDAASTVSTQALESASAESGLETQAVKWHSITTPEQLRVINLKSEGYGPGYYRIDNDFTLGDQPTGDYMATCGLLSGSFVIDFNGHTVQSACESLSTFIVQGANVTFMDSKASTDKVSVRALGICGIEVRAGSATILNGNYLCDKYTSMGGAAVSNVGGTLTVNGGAFQGSQAALSTSGGTTVINNGVFYGGYPWALLDMGGTIKIVRGAFYGQQNYYGYSFAIGAYTGGQAFNFGALLADSSTWNATGQYYYSGTSSVSLYPGLSYSYAVIGDSAIVVSGPQSISVLDQTKTFGDKTFNLGAKTNGDGTLSYTSSNEKVATIDSSGNVIIKGAGKTKITVSASETNFSKTASKEITLVVKKAANTMTAKGLTATVSATKTTKKAQTTKKLVKTKAAKGTVTFAKKSGDKQLFINKTTGKVKVNKGTAAGTYHMRVKVTATGTSNYKKTTKTVTITVKVK